jgi:hypothetical protein
MAAGLNTIRLHAAALLQKTGSIAFSVEKGFAFDCFPDRFPAKLDDASITIDHNRS